MTQYILPDLLVEDPDGSEFAAMMNSWQAALTSCHIGAARPSYAVRGTIWIRDTGGTLTVMLYNGTTDIEIVQLGSLSDYAKLASPSFTGSPTAPTPASGNNTTRVATTAFVANAVANLIATAPASLDTLNELAAALGDDPNFATTMTNALAAKVPTSRQITPGTGLTGGGNFSADRTISASIASQDEAEAGTNATKLMTPQRVKDSIVANVNGNVAQGPGSGLNADKVDNLEGSQFLRSDTNDFMTGLLHCSRNANEVLRLGYNVGATRDTSLSFFRGGTARSGYLQALADRLRLDRDGGALLELFDSGDVRINDNKVMHTGNGGAGSGFDADLLDGQHGSFYRDASNLNAGTVPDAQLPGTISSDITGNAATATSAATATNCSRSVGAGTGLSGGGELTADQTLSVDETWLAGQIAALAQGIGEGQTWQDVRSSRLPGVSYQNITGRTITVAMEGRRGNASQIQISSDGINWRKITTTPDDDVGYAVFNSAIFPVPQGDYYRFDNSNTAVSVWMELR